MSGAAGADVNWVRRAALAHEGAVEMDHHGAPSFRIDGRIFCTVRPDGRRIMVKLDPEDQRNLCEGHRDCMSAVPGYWGRQGATFVDLAAAPRDLIETLLAMAFANARARRRRRPA